MALKIYYSNEINKDVIKDTNRIAAQYNYLYVNTPFDDFVDSTLYNFNKRYIDNIKPLIHEAHRSIKEHNLQYIIDFIEDVKLNYQDERLIFRGNNWILTTNRDYTYDKSNNIKLPIIELNALLTDKDNTNINKLENAVDMKEAFELLALSSLSQIKNGTLYLGCFDAVLKADTTYKMYRKMINKNCIKEQKGQMIFINKKMFYDTMFTITPTYLETLLNKYDIKVEDKEYDYKQLIKR